MKRLLLQFLLIFTTHSLINLQAQSRVFNEKFEPDTTVHTLRALAFSQIPNLSIWGINRYVLKNHFAYINLHTIEKNILQQPLWDYDQFGTNLLAHPFHGSLDYTAARVNGFNYYESIPFVFASSLIWEYILENEPASINDQITTTLGGMLWGEVSFRLSSSILKNQSVGLERVCREFLGTLMSPMNGIKRAVTGEMWRVTPQARLYKTIPISLQVGSGVRWLSQNSKNQLGSYLHLLYNYGNPMKASSTPFESFHVNAVLDPFSKQSFITHLSATGAVFTRSTEFKNTDITYGLYQHYLYMDALSNNNQCVYYRYSEPATFGFGLLTENSKSSIRSESYLNALPLAAAYSLPFELLERDYNFGFGYGVRHITSYHANRLSAKFDFRFSHFFTTVGYHKELDLSEQDYKTFYSMGDKGNTWMLNCKAQVDYRISKELSLSLKYNYIKQNTNNRDFPNFSLTSTDCYLGLNHRF
ncbi:MAG: DUF3943 domain-containing protein [Phocaeicola sp.]